MTDAVREGSSGVAGGDIHPEAAVAPGFLANHAAQTFNRMVDGVLRQHGLSLALIGPVMLLAWKGPMLQRDLVRASAVRQPAMVALLDKLEAMGLVTRTPVPEDRRAATVALTLKGAEMAALGGKVLLDINGVGTDGFSERESALLVSLLQRFIRALDTAEGTKHQT